MYSVINLASQSLQVMRGDCGTVARKEALLHLCYMAEFFASINPEAYFNPRLRIRQITKAYVMTHTPDGFTRAVLNFDKRRTMRMRNRFRRRAWEE